MPPHVTCDHLHVVAILLGYLVCHNRLYHAETWTLLADMVGKVQIAETQLCLLWYASPSPPHP